MSSCYSHPWFQKNFFVSLTVFLFFRTVLFLCVAVPCNPTFTYWFFFTGKEKEFQMLLWLAAEQIFQSLSFNLSLFYAELAQGMSSESEQIFIYSCLWLEALSFWSRYFANSCSLLLWLAFLKRAKKLFKVTFSIFWREDYFIKWYLAKFPWNIYFPSVLVLINHVCL